MQTMTFNGISIQECMDFVNRYIQLVDNQLAFIKPEIGNGFNQSMAQNNTIQLPDVIAQTAGTSILNAEETQRMNSWSITITTRLNSIFLV
jgi:hypothetical protein